MKAIISIVLALTFLAGTGLCQTADLLQTVTVTNALGQVTNLPASVLTAATSAGETNTGSLPLPPEIRAYSGGAIADYGLLNVRFTPHPAESRPVSISRRNSRTIAFRPTYIALVKRSTGDAWILGQVTNSVLEVSGSDVLWREAFDSISADLRYSYGNGNRLEQFITIREKIVLPKELEDCEADVDLECWTEFFLENNALSIEETPVLLREAQLGLPAVEAADQSTDLGNLKIPGGGKAFGIGEEEDTIPVAKTWIQVGHAGAAIDGAQSPRRFLCERADWLSIKPKLDKLPKHPGHAALQKRKTTRALLARLAPPAAPAQATPAPVLLARNSSPANSGLVIDFAVVAPPGLIAWWRGEGNTLDTAGGHDGQPQGEMGYAAAKVGQGFNLDGTDDWVSVPWTLPLNFGAGEDFSIEGWIKPLSATTTYGIQMVLDQRVTTQYDDGAVGYAFYLVYGQVACQLADAPLVSGQYHAYGPAGPDLRTNGIYHHVAMTVDRDFTNGLMLYVDGVAVYTNNPTFEPGSLSTTNFPLRIGKHATVNAPFKGPIDELSIYYKALSQAEVQSIFNAGSDGKIWPPVITAQPQSQTVAAGASATFTVVASGEAPLSYQWYKGGQPIPGATAATCTLLNVQPADVGYYMVVVANRSGSAQSVNAALALAGSCLPPASGQVGWWRAEGSASDSSPSGNNGVFTGSYVGGEVGQAFAITSTSTAVRVPASTTLNVGPGPGLTVEGWLKPYDTVARPFVEWATSGTFGVHIWVNFPSPGYVWVNLFGTDGHSHGYQSAPGLIVANTFQHLAVTYDRASGQSSLFINGVPQQPVTLGAFTPRTTPDLYLGLRPSFVPYGPAAFNGLIDEVALHGRALSAAEIQAIYAAGALGKCTSAKITLDSTPATYIEDSGAVLISPNAAAVDCDTLHGDKLVVTIQNGQTNYDYLTIAAQGGIQITNTYTTSGWPEYIPVVNGQSVAYNGVTFGNIAGILSVHSPLTINFNEAATCESIQALIRSVMFWNDCETPDTTTRTIRFELLEADGRSNSSTINLSVTAVNEPPAVHFPQGAVRCTQGTPPVLLLDPGPTGASVSDPDTLSVSGGAIRAASSLWMVDDDTPSGGDLITYGGDSWATAWVTANPAPFSGRRALQSALATGWHQLGVQNVFPGIWVGPGDKLFAYVYLDSAHLPSEVMLQWQTDSSWEHRAFWGLDRIIGADTTTPRNLYMGPVPAAGQWIRLEVPASDVALEGKWVYGIAFTLFDGKATWDCAGKTHGDEVFGIRNQGTDAGQIGLSGNAVFYGGQSIGTFAGGADGVPLFVSLNGSANTAGANALLQNLTYQNTSPTPGNPSRAVYVAVSEGTTTVPAVSPSTLKAVHMLCPSQLDVMLVIDRSGSMGVGTPGSTSLDYAKQTALNFLNFMNPATDQVGLITFSGSASLDSDLTTQYDSVRTAISTNSAAGGTALGDAIYSARTNLAASPRFGQALSVIVVLSDGESNTDTIRYPFQAAAEAKSQGIRVIVVALNATAGWENVLRDVASARDQSPAEEFDFYTAINGVDLCSKYLAIARSLCRTSTTWADAGPNQRLVAPPFPASTTVSGTLNGEVCDPTYHWENIEGPDGVIIGHESSASTDVSFAQAGVYLLQFTASKGTQTWHDQLLIHVDHANTAPVVYAGSDRSVTLPQNTSLLIDDSSVVDPDSWPAALAVSWKKISGPGSVQFLSAAPDPNIAHIRVRFGAPGEYLLRLSASDSELAGQDELTVHVTAADDIPLVNAGPDQTLTLPSFAYLPGTVQDDHPDTLSVTWSKVSGEGEVIFDNEHLASTMASFSKPGTYVLRLTAIDSAQQTASDSATLIVRPFSETESFQNVGVVSAGIGSLKDEERAVLTLQGVAGLVKKACLYWHGSTDSSDLNANQSILVNGRLFTGCNIGVAQDNRWYVDAGHRYANSQAYRADITPLVLAFGSGEYELRGLSKAKEAEANGASMIVIFDEPNPANRRDVVLWQGNDSNYGLSYQINNAVSSIRVQADGRLLLGGSFSYISGNEPRNHLGRLLPNGILDMSFDPGSGPADASSIQIKSFLIRGDGSILVAGAFGTFDGQAHVNLVKLAANGAVDADFNSPVPNGIINTLVEQADGKIIIAGDFTQLETALGPQTRVRVARLNQDGSLDVQFDPGPGPDAEVKAACLSVNGLLIAGAFSGVASTPCGRIARLNSSGTLDTTFNAAGTGANATVNALAIDSSGKPVIGGDFTTFNNQVRTRVARLNPNGSLDENFTPWAPDNSVRAVAIQSDNKVLIAGSFNLHGRVARLSQTDGTLDAGFDAGTGAASPINAIAVEDTGTILVAGEFSSFSGKERLRVARLDQSGKLLLSPAEPEWRVEAPAVNFTSGQATLELHVSDGQYEEGYQGEPGYTPFADPSLSLNGAIWWQPAVIPTCNGGSQVQLFAGNSVPNSDPNCRGLWDIKQGPTIGPSSGLVLESVDSGDDCLCLVAVVAKLPVGSVSSSGSSVPLPADQTPVAHADEASAHHGTRTKLIDVLANDYSPGGALLTITAVGTPFHGTTEAVFGGSAIAYSPHPDFVGNDSFDYTAVDANGNTATATVSVTVIGAEPTPLYCNQIESGALDALDQESLFRGAGQRTDFYKFSVNTGVTFTLDVLEPEFPCHIYLRDALGMLVASASHSTIGPPSLQFTAKASGVFTVEVTSHSPRQYGTYKIKLTNLDNCSPAPRLQVWADGINIPDLGVIDFGIDTTKTITIRNAGTANTTEVLVELLSSFTAIPTTLPQLPPNASAEVLLRLNDITTPGPRSEAGLVHDLAQGINFTAKAYVPTPGTGPTINLTAPFGGTVFHAPSDISIAAEITSGTASKVQFFAATPAGRILLGEKTAAPYTCLWRNPPIGSYLLSAWAYDSAGHVGTTPQVPISVAKRIPNAFPVAADDYALVQKNSTDNLIRVLYNDSDSNGDPLIIVTVAAQNGAAQIGTEGKTIMYSPPPDSYGEDLIEYTISDGRNGLSTGRAYITILDSTVAIFSPAENATFTAGQVFEISATASTSEGAIAKVEFFANNKKIGESFAPAEGYYRLLWNSQVTGVYALQARALDSHGLATLSDPVRIRIGNVGDMPIAEISNLTDGQVVREGRFEARGTASNVNQDPGLNIAYTLRLYRSDNYANPPCWQLIADYTPATTGRKVNEVLGVLDFSRVRNGAYVLELEVDGQLASDVSFILENNLKVGAFTFSEQDLVLPASGMPLTLVRTYSSFNPAVGQFGHGWTLSVSDVELEINEDRAMTTDNDPDPGDPPTFNMRVAGGRDVTLSLPDGRRTTFAFYLEQGACQPGDEADFCYYAKWKSPPGVTATLSALPGEDRIVAFWGGFVFWTAAPLAGLDNYDFSGFTLKMLDGTEYTIKREDLGEHHYGGGRNFVHAYGQAHVTSIRTVSGDHTVIGEQTGTAPFSISSYTADNTKTRSVRINRNNDGYISEIYDAKAVNPATGDPIPGSLPAIKYDYVNGDLTAVHKLVNKDGATEAERYAVVNYIYDPSLPHYISEIRDPLNNPAARNRYDPDGRLFEIKDAAGNITTFEHDLEGRRETVIDPLLHRTDHIYDERGNVTSTTDPLGHTTSRTYDLEDHLLTDTDPLSKTTTYSYSGPNKLLEIVTDPLKHTTRYTYNDNGQIKTVTDARGHLTVNSYEAGNLKTTTQTLRVGMQDETPVSTTYEYYNDSKLLKAVIDPVNALTEYGYDAAGNVIRTTFFKDADRNTVLSETICAEEWSWAGGYDANGNRLVERITRQIPDTSPQEYETAVTRFQYDDQNRLIKTTLPLNAAGSEDYITRTTYNLQGKPETTTDMLGRVTSHRYDVRGNLSQTEFPDGTVTRTVYDALGRAEITTDKHNAPTGDQTVTTANGSRTVYDPAGRAIRTERLKNISIHVPNTGSTRNSELRDPPPLVISSSSTEYDDAGHIRTARDQRGSVTTYTYDDAGRRNTVQDALGRVSSYSYDENGNQTSFTDALERVMIFEYDELNRLISTRPPVVDGETPPPVAVTIFDKAGRRVGETDLSGVTTGLKYDAMGRLIEVTNAFDLPEQTITKYVYDEASNLIEQQDAAGRSTKFAYDKLGRRTKRTLPIASPRSEDTSYEIVPKDTTPGAPRVLRTKKVGFDSRTVYYVNDEMDRLHKKIYGTDPSGAPVATFEYWPDGKRKQMVDALGTTSYFYDDFGFLSQKDTPLGGTTKYSLSYAHDPLGHVKGMRITPYLTYPRVYDVAYTWDDLGRLENSEWLSSTPEHGSASYGYDRVGNLEQTTITTPPLAQIQSQYHYDQRNRLTDLSVTTDGNPVASFNYNPVDRPLGRTGVRMAARESIGSASRFVNYSYDKLYRLTREDIPAGAVTGNIVYDDAPEYAAGSGYDRVGNRQSRSSTVAGVQPTAAAVHFDRNDRFDNDAVDTTASAYFDVNGNTITPDLNGDGLVDATEATYSYTYDEENRLITASGGGKTITIVYDGDGNRIRKTVLDGTTRVCEYLVDDQNPTGYPQVLAELDGSTHVGTRMYFYGHTVLSQQRYVGGSWTGDFYGLDGHNNVRLLFNTAGAVTDTCSYDAFGILVEQTPENRASRTPNTRLYCSEEYDEDLGLYYLRARYYSPQIGRFWTMDTFERNQEDALSLHKYLYAHADPVNRIDPSGNTDFIQTLASMGIQLTVQTLNAARGAPALLAARTLPLITLGTTYLTQLGPRALEYIRSLGVQAIPTMQRVLQHSTTVVSRSQALQSQNWSSFPQLKAALNPLVNAGSRSNPANIRWHHIIEQTRGVQQFGERAINSLANIVPTPTPIHLEITKIYSSGHSWLPGFSRLRDFTSTKSWEEQYRIGMQIWQHVMATGGNMNPQTVKSIVLGP
ncbi:MAG TPA: LamG-like jellyroll fold domain-containing protein [Verrucomicrobiae bacterium]